jgi:hypothetical protein
VVSKVAKADGIGAVADTLTLVEGMVVVILGAVEAEDVVPGVVDLSVGTVVDNLLPPMMGYISQMKY